MPPFRLGSYNDPRFLAKAGLGAVFALPSRLETAELPAVLGQRRAVVLVRLTILILPIVALAACSSATPPPPSDPQASAAILKKGCSDPKWQEENLGLWYSVCRQPLRW
jgi:hypothetical protein